MMCVWTCNGERWEEWEGIAGVEGDRGRMGGEEKANGGRLHRVGLGWVGLMTGRRRADGKQTGRDLRGQADRGRQTCHFDADGYRSVDEDM